MGDVAARHHALSSDQPHHAWDNALPPRLVVRPGNSVTLEIRDEAAELLGPDIDAASLVETISGGHPLSGPIYVEGARPGDTLQVEVLAVETAARGWTIILPGWGLLP